MTSEDIYPRPPLKGEESPDDKAEGMKSNLDKLYKGENGSFRLYFSHDNAGTSNPTDHKETEQEFLRRLGAGFKDIPITTEPTRVYEREDSDIGVYRWTSCLDENMLPIDAFYEAATSANELKLYSNAAF